MLFYMLHYRCPISLPHPAFLQSVHQFMECRKHSTDSSVSDRWNGEQLGLPVPPWLCQSLFQPVPPGYSAQSWISALWRHAGHWSAQRISLRERHPRAAGCSLDTHHTSFLIDSRALCTDFPVTMSVSERALDLCNTTKIRSLDSYIKLYWNEQVHYAAGRSAWL